MSRTNFRSWCACQDYLLSNKGTISLSGQGSLYQEENKGKCSYLPEKKMPSTAAKATSLSAKQLELQAQATCQLVPLGSLLKLVEVQIPACGGQSNRTPIVPLNPFHGPLSLSLNSRDVLNGMEQASLLLRVFDVCFEKQTVHLCTRKTVYGLVLHGSMNRLQLSVLTYLSGCSLSPSESSRMLWPAAYQMVSLDVLSLDQMSRAEAAKGYLWELQLSHEPLTQVF